MPLIILYKKDEFLEVILPIMFRSIELAYFKYFFITDISEKTKLIFLERVSSPKRGLTLNQKFNVSVDFMKISNISRDFTALPLSLLTC